MVVKELTISFYPKFPSIFFKIGYFTIFGQLLVKIYITMTVLSLHRSNDILWLYFLSYATGFPFEFVIFFICLLVFYVNLCFFHRVFEICYMTIIISNCPNPSIGSLPSPLFLMEIFSWTVSFLSPATQLSSWNWSSSLICI